MGVREIDRSLEQRQMGEKDLRRRMIVAPAPRERERWHATLLPAQGWTAAVAEDELDRARVPSGSLYKLRRAWAFGEGGRAALISEQAGGSPSP